MADYESPEQKAQSQEDESVFVAGMIRIIDQQGTVVVEHGSRLFELHPVLAFVLGILLLIPLEMQFYHINEL